MGLMQVDDGASAKKGRGEHEEKKEGDGGRVGLRGLLLSMRESCMLYFHLFSFTT